jgi:UDP-4-amino-4-deoxy-L-arabinose formyltransferase/UDP-glucuronic acid dehydrogenase (UDP-4-keto-hexauronic acid decarboxylating)
MKFAALGRTRWLYDAVAAAQARGHRCVLIATAEASPEYAVNESDFERLAKDIGCPFIFDARIETPEHVAVIERSGADIAISVNWPNMLAKAVRDRFPRGVLNAHAGDLPRYRGNACPNWAILNGEPETVATIHEMVDELDAGPILLQDRLPLTEQTYIGEIYRWLDAGIPALFARALDGLEAGRLQGRPQPDDPRLSLRCYPRRPEDGLIDWRLPARHIARLVRASSEPFAGAYTFLAEQRVRIWRAQAGTLPHRWCGAPGQVARRDRQDGTVTVLTGEGVLIVEEIETSRDGRVRAADGIRSARARLGVDAVEHIVTLRRRLAELEQRLAGGTENDAGVR